MTLKLSLKQLMTKYSQRYTIIAHNVFHICNNTIGVYRVKAVNITSLGVAVQQR